MSVIISETRCFATGEGGASDASAGAQAHAGAAA